MKGNAIAQSYIPSGDKKEDFNMTKKPFNMITHA